VASHSFVIYLIIGIILIIPLGVLMTAASEEAVSAGLTPFFTFDVIPALIIFIFPLIFALFGTILNTFIALIYNLYSKKSGGVKYKTRKQDHSQHGAPAAF
jgi:hypothetical protein